MEQFLRYLVLLATLVRAAPAFAQPLPAPYTITPQEHQALINQLLEGRAREVIPVINFLVQKAHQAAQQPQGTQTPAPGAQEAR